MKDEICQIIRSNRPSISDGSLKTYCSVLNSLYNKLGGQNGIAFFQNEPDKIITHIETLEKPQTKKTILSALYVLTGDASYHEPMLKFSNETNEAYKKKKTDPERLANQPTTEELKNLYKKYETNLKNNPTELNFINFFIVALTSGQGGIPPRRLQDWTEMKHRNYNPEIDNFMTKKEFVFNKFKTAKHTLPEDRRVPVPKQLTKYINKWIAKNPSEYFLTNSEGNKFTSSSFNKRLNSIYGKNVGVDVLRSVSWTAKADEIAVVEKLKKKAKQMGHSLESAMSYYVKED
jgi:integrase